MARVLGDGMYSIDKNGWLVVDEIGPLELRGEGFSDVLKMIVRERKERTLLVVRKALIDDVISQFELYRFEVNIIDVDGVLPD